MLNAWTHGDLITVDDMAMSHTEHSSMYQRNEEVWKHHAQNRPGDYERADGIVGYAWVARYTLEFLNAYLKHDAGSMQFLKKTPAENGVPLHTMAVDFRAAQGTPATFEALRIETGKQGFDQLADIYAAMKKDQSDFKISERDTNVWATELKEDGHLPEAIAVLKLAIQNYPDAGDAYENLGEAYVQTGEKQLAIESYQKALEKDPENSDIRQKLAALQGTPVVK